jgi:hypothetical protein
MRLKMRSIFWKLALIPAMATTAFSDDLTVSSFSSYAGQTNIALQATGNVIISGGPLNLPDLPSGASIGVLTIQAGNNITIQDGTGIVAGSGWTVSLVAGTALTGSTPTSGSDGIYLDGAAYIQTQNGNISLWAANEVQTGWMGTGTGSVNGGTGSITTAAGGNIAVTAQYGDVNTGSDANGFLYKQPTGLHHNILVPPYYTVSPSLGGISTAAGGNVTINAGGNVLSYLPAGTESDDAGTGAFGSQPGNVTITASNNVYGHYVLANGLGTITAVNNVGVPSGGNSVALSVIDGDWDVTAQNGNIYLQEVRNPNGVFNSTGNDGSVAAHLFDYGSQATVSLTAGNGVYLTDVNVPRLSVADEVPIIYPPILNVTAGSGGVTLHGNMTLFPSAYQDLTITTTAGGNLQSIPNNPGSTPELLMSDSSKTQWAASNGSFSDTDHGTIPNELNNPNPVVINISGSMENLNLITSEASHITVDGNMTGCGYSGQNLSSSDVTSITVLGQLYNQSPYSFVNSVTIPAIPNADLLPGMAESWDDVFTLALNPATIANLTVPNGTPASQLASYAIESASLFPIQVEPSGQLLGTNPGFVYNTATGRLGFAGAMNTSVESALGSGQITILHLVNGLPVLDSNGHFLTDTYNWAPPADVQTLYTESQSAPSLLNGNLGYRIGGPGQFDITAGSIELGNTYGILSCDVFDPQGGYGRYASLVPLTPSGATVNVTVSGDLDMLTSAIATIGGGDVNVTSTGGSIYLGSQELINTVRQVGFGVYTAGAGNVNVTAYGDIDIDGSRIAAFNGGNIFVESQTGEVNVGSGGNTVNGVSVSYINSDTGQAALYTEAALGSGILSCTLVDTSQVPGSAAIPGNITVETPQGDIITSQDGILQEALNGNISGHPAINLNAGSNIDLGNSGLIGDTITLSASGSISGYAFAPQLLNTSLVQTNQSLSVAIRGTLTAQEIASLVIQTSTNLVDWTPTNLPFITNGSGGLSFQAPISSNPGSGFYRILSQ